MSQELKSRDHPDQQAKLRIINDCQELTPRTAKILVGDNATPGIQLSKHDQYQEISCTS
jgi:hypothetical protein